MNPHTPRPDVGDDAARARERWRQIEPLIDGALDRAAHERGPFLDAACAGDDALRAELERLLATHDLPHLALDTNAAERFASLFDGDAAPPPDVLGGRYRIDGEIGRGGMATVYRAHDIRHGRTVAIKVVHRELVATLGAERFLAEIQTTAQLQHPHILPLHDSGEVDGFLFYVMPYVEGESLRRRLERETRLPVDDAIRIATEVASALDAAHRQGVIHRDIKPENILLQDGTALLADFGIALATGAGGAAHRPPGLTFGTPQYISPEQAAGTSTIDGRTDVYALGTVVFDFISGVVPFVGTSAADVLAQRTTTAAPPLHAVRPDIPRAIDAAVAQALARDPHARFRTAGDFAIALGTAPALPRRTAHAALAFATGIAVLAATAYGAILMRGHAARVADAQASIVVLPLRTGNGSPVDSEFADAVTVELIDALARTGRVSVIASTSSFAFKGHPTDVRKIADSLQAANVMEGDLERTGSHIHLTLRLAAADGKVRWSQTYDREMADAAMTFADIGRAVAAKLNGQPPGRPSTYAADHQTRNPAAYDLYLRGRQQRELRNDTAFAKAMDYFGQAIALDSNYAAAYAALAEVSGVRSLGTNATRLRMYGQARTTALKAIALDDSLPEGHMALGMLQLYPPIDLSVAESELTRSLALDPKGSLAHQYLAILYCATGRATDALAEARGAVLLDPLSVTAIREVGRALFYAHQYDDALVQLDRAQTMGPANRMAQLIAGEVYAKQGKFAQALVELRGRPSILGRALLGHTLARAGQRAEATQILGDLLDRERAGTGGAFYVAIVYAGLGDLDRAFAWLDKAFDDGSFRLEIMDPTFDDLRADPRFAGVRKRLGLQ